MKSARPLPLDCSTKPTNWVFELLRHTTELHLRPLSTTLCHDSRRVRKLVKRKLIRLKEYLWILKAIVEDLEKTTTGSA
jgi:hypothetical protein